MGYKLCERVSIEHVDGHDILITERGDAAVLNETAEYVLNCLLNRIGYEEVIQKTSEIYDTDSSIVTKDVEVLVCELMNKELLESRE